MSSVFETLQSRDIRQLGINPNHWYVVARSSEVTTKPVGVVIWQQAIALYRVYFGQIESTIVLLLLGGDKSTQ